MIDPIIKKLTSNYTGGSIPCKEDVRIGLELLRYRIYPDIPEEVKKYLWCDVRCDVLEEYFIENSNCVGHIADWKIKWKEI